MLELLGGAEDVAGAISGTVRHVVLALLPAPASVSSKMEFSGAWGW